MKSKAKLEVPTGLSADGIAEIVSSLNALLADVFALYLKTKNFHWHMTGPHFRDYHLLLDEHGDQIFAMTDDIAERARKLGNAYASLHQRHYRAPAPGGQQQRAGHSARDVVGAL